MKQRDIVEGACYRAKVSDKLAVVRIGAAADPGWTAVNLATNRTVHIRSAQRLRTRVCSRCTLFSVAPTQERCVECEHICRRCDTSNVPPGAGHGLCIGCSQAVPPMSATRTSGVLAGVGA